MRTFLFWCLGLSAAASALAQQAPSTTPPFKTGVEAVEIDVRALDEHGRPVSGLSASDFEVLDDGVRQDIRVFTPVAVPTVPRARSANTIEPDTHSNREAFNGRIYVFVLDDLHTHPLRSQRVKAAVHQFIDRHFAANDRAAIVTTSGRRETAQELTGSVAALNRAIDAFAGQQLRASTLERIEEYYRLRNVGESMVDKDNNPITIKDPLDADRANQARRALNSLRDVTRWLDSVPARHKAVIFVSEGIDYDLTNLVNNTYAAGLVGDVRDVLSNAARSNTSIYAIDPRGLAGVTDDAIEISGLPDETTRLGYSAFAEALRWTQDNLRVLADESGGFALLNTNDLNAGFERIVRENSEYYVLGYQPTSERRDGRFRRIEVRINKPGIRAVARRGYFAPRTETPRPDPTDGMRALIDSPLPVSGLPIDTAATVFRGSKGKASVLVTAEIGPDIALTDKDGIYHGQVSVSVVAVDVGGKIAAADNPVVTLNLRPATMTAVKAYGLRATSRLELKPGRYQLRIAAKDGTSGQAGSVLSDLVVADFEKAPVAVSQVLLGSRGAMRIATTTSDPMLKGVIDVPPTAIRQFDQTDTLTVFAEIYDNRSKGVDPVALMTTITDETGTVRYRTEERIQGFAFDPSRHAYQHHLSIPVKDFAPGQYVLRVTANDPTLKDGPVRREIAFSVRGAASATH